jgi:hypothetical protein
MPWIVCIRATGARKSLTCDIYSLEFGAGSYGEIQFQDKTSPMALV